MSTSIHASVRDWYEGFDTEIFDWETLLAADEGRQPNTSKPSNQDQNKLKKGIFIPTLTIQ
jgi:hypothetical protein